MALWDNNGGTGFGGFNTGANTDTGFATNTTDTTTDATDTTFPEPDETSVTPDTTVTDTEATAEEKPETEEKTTGRKEHQTRKKGLPKLDASSAQKIGELWETLRTSEGASAAKLILGVGTNSPASLLALLTETKNQRKVAEVADKVKKLKSDDPVETQMNLLMAFVEDKDLAKTVAGLMRTVAPEGKTVPNPSGNPKADARNLANAWDDSIDLSVINKLRV